MKKSTPDPHQYDLEEAIARSIESQATALANEDASWKDKYHALVDRFFYELPPKATFIGEDMRKYAEEHIGQPHHPNVWGAISGAKLRAWQKGGYIRKIGEAPMTKKTSHARATALYEKL